MKRATILLLCLMADIAMPEVATAEQQTVPPVFKTARHVAAKVREEYCRERPFYRVTVMRNADGEIGGYVLQPAIRDAPIPYLDAEGEALTTFHIFASDAEKRTAMTIITPLRSRFPLEAPLDCSAS